MDGKVNNSSSSLAGSPLAKSKSSGALLRSVSKLSRTVSRLTKTSSSNPNASGGSKSVEIKLPPGVTKNPGDDINGLVVEKIKPKKILPHEKLLTPAEVAAVRTIIDRGFMPKLPSSSQQFSLPGTNNSSALSSGGGVAGGHQQAGSLSVPTGSTTTTTTTNHLSRNTTPIVGLDGLIWVLDQLQVHQPVRNIAPLGVQRGIVNRTLSVPDVTFVLRELKLKHLEARSSRTRERVEESFEALSEMFAPPPPSPSTSDPSPTHIIDGQQEEVILSSSEESASTKAESGKVGKSTPTTPDSGGPTVVEGSASITEQKEEGGTKKRQHPQKKYAAENADDEDAVAEAVKNVVEIQEVEKHAKEYVHFLSFPYQERFSQELSALKRHHYQLYLKEQQVKKKEEENRAVLERTGGDPFHPLSTESELELKKARGHVDKIRLNKFLAEEWDLDIQELGGKSGSNKRNPLLLSASGADSSGNLSSSNFSRKGVPKALTNLLNQSSTSTAGGDAFPLGVSSAGDSPTNGGAGKTAKVDLADPEHLWQTTLNRSKNINISTTTTTGGAAATFSSPERMNNPKDNELPHYYGGRLHKHTNRGVRNTTGDSLSRPNEEGDADEDDDDDDQKIESALLFFEDEDTLFEDPEEKIKQLQAAAELLKRKRGGKGGEGSSDRLRALLFSEPTDLVSDLRTSRSMRKLLGKGGATPGLDTVKAAGRNGGHGGGARSEAGTIRGAARSEVASYISHGARSTRSRGAPSTILSGGDSSSRGRNNNNSVGTGRGTGSTSNPSIDVQDDYDLPRTPRSLNSEDEREEGIREAMAAMGRTRSGVHNVLSLELLEEAHALQEANVHALAKEIYKKKERQQRRFERARTGKTQETEQQKRKKATAGRLQDETFDSRDRPHSALSSLGGQISQTLPLKDLKDLGSLARRPDLYLTHGNMDIYSRGLQRRGKEVKRMEKVKQRRDTALKEKQDELWHQEQQRLRKQQEEQQEAAEVEQQMIEVSNNSLAGASHPLAPIETPTSKAKKSVKMALPMAVEQEGPSSKAPLGIVGAGAEVLELKNTGNNNNNSEIYNLSDVEKASSNSATVPSYLNQSETAIFEGHHELPSFGDTPPAGSGQHPREETRRGSAWSKHPKHRPTAEEVEDEETKKRKKKQEEQFSHPDLPGEDPTWELAMGLRGRLGHRRASMMQKQVSAAIRTSPLDEFDRTCPFTSDGVREPKKAEALRQECSLAVAKIAQELAPKVKRLDQPRRQYFLKL